MGPEGGEHRRFEFDVFLSFTREGDLLNGFIDGLTAAFKQRGVRASFVEQEENLDDPVDQMAVTALRAIEVSEISLPIFSRGFADSKLLLMQVAEMVERGRLIIPVFHDVEPRQVKRQEGPFKTAFRKHEESKEINEKTVERWRGALREVGEIKGYDVQNDADGKEGKIIPLIVKDVVVKVKRVALNVAKYPVGLDSRVNHMMKLLDVETPGLRMIGIYGMGGVGKTTLAKAVYNRISSRYKASCFFSNIKEVSAKYDGLVSLQKQLILEVLNDKHTSITSVSQGINNIKRIQSRTVLIVLDDVSDIKQLQALAGERNWFSPRSRVIITTRNRHILNLQGLKEDELYKLEELNMKESLQLFSYHALGTAKPLKKYVDLSRRAVRVTGGLPLTLEVFGSLFFDKNDPEEWEELLVRLKRDQPEDVHVKLKISYDALDVNEKRIFLDIACFFIGTGKESAIHMWKDSHFFPIIGIKVLLHKSLIKINKDDEFEMHDQLRDLGRHIVVQESPSNPGQRSRLWDSGEALEVLHNLQGTSYVEGIDLQFWKEDLTCLRTKAFSAMFGLRLLLMAYVSFIGKFTCIPNTVKWLKWEGCPFESLPSEFNFQEVVVLDLSSGMISEVWNRNVSTIKAFDRLKVLNLKNCEHLTATPDFSSTPHIVKLVLAGCSTLAQVHESIGFLKSLIYLSMKDCFQLKELPNCICQLSSLETLDLHRCYKISALPTHMGDMKSIKHLILDQTKVKELPDSMTQLKKLILLSLDGCRSMTELPQRIGSVESLRNLTFQGSTVERIPESIGNLSNLLTLNAERSSILALPHSIGNAKNLRGIYVDHTPIREVPESVGSLERLETLSLDGCNHIEALPSSIGLLKNLAELSVGTEMGSTGGIRELTECFGNLTALRRLYIDRNPGLLTVPSSFFQISTLENLSARGCNWLEGIDGSDFSKLSSLKELDLSDSNFYTLPSLASFSFLKRLSLRLCERLWSIPQLPSSLEELDAMNCPALEIISDVSHLKALGVLKLDRCTKLVDVTGLEKLRSLENLTLHSCSNLSHALRDRIKDAEFEYLSYFTISGTLGLHQSKDQVLSFVLPKMFRCNHPQLQIAGNFKDRNATTVHIEVMVDNLLLFATTREPNLQLDDYCICYFEEGDEMLTHVGNGYRIMHVSIDGFTMAGATIYMGNLESF